MHAGGELGPQMDQVFLKGCGKCGKKELDSYTILPSGDDKMSEARGRSVFGEVCNTKTKK